MAKKVITEGTPSEVEKKEVVTTDTTKEVEIEVKPVVERKYSYWEYCNLLGASSSVHFVAKMKFKSVGKKTTSEWETLFKENKIV